MMGDNQDEEHAAADAAGSGDEEVSTIHRWIDLLNTMLARRNRLALVKRLLNTLIIVCIPFGLFFAGAVIGYEISYEDFDLQEKASTARWSELDHRIVANLNFYQRAGIGTLFAFTALVIARIRLSKIQEHSSSEVS